jgi:hypothetical protein
LQKSVLLAAMVIMIALLHREESAITPKLESSAKTADSARNQLLR